MKKFARLFALVLALCMLASTGFASELINTEGTYPIVKEPYKVSIGFVANADGIDLEKYNFVAYMDYMTGLDIEWTGIDFSAAGERLPIMMATGDMPDAMIRVGFNPSTVLRYGVQEELLRPVNDLLQYMPLFSKILENRPEVRADITCLDGNIYGFPCLISQDNGFQIRFWYNEQWLKALNLEIPTTLDEFYNVLVAFRDGDPNGNGEKDEIPFSGSWDESYAERTAVMTAMGFNSYGINVGLDFTTEQPTAGYFPYTAQFRNYIEFMKKLNDEGLLDPDMFTQSEIQYNAKTQEGIVGFGAGGADYNMNPDPEVYTGYIPMSSDVYGTPLYTKAASSVDSISMIINADVSDEKAIVLAKLGDAFYDPRTNIETFQGVDAGSELDFFGWGRTYDEETKKVVYVSKPEEVSDWTFRCKYMAPYQQPGYCTYAENYLPYVQTYTDTAAGRHYAENGYVYEDWNLEFQAKSKPYENYVMPAMYMTTEDTERLNELQVPLDDYAASMEAKFITGAVDIAAEWDGYIAELEALGVKEYVEIYSKYWNDYYASLTK